MKCAFKRACQARARLCAGGALALSLLLGPSLALADNNPTNITKGELALLPEYCPDTQSFGYGDASYNPSPRAPYWIGLMGKTFWAMHHVCWAMIREHRSRAAGTTLQIRNGLLRGANNDYEYVVQHATPDFILLPEIFTRMGDNFVLLGEYGVAMETFSMARKAKPDYWPPYVSWAKVLMRIGKRAEALAHVEQVLALAPDDQELKRQYAMLKSGQSASQSRARAMGTAAAPATAAAAPAGSKGAKSAVAPAASAQPQLASGKADLTTASASASSPRPSAAASGGR